jgi:hypothetical protein
MLIWTNKRQVRSIKVARRRLRHIENRERHAKLLRGFNQSGAAPWFRSEAQEREAIAKTIVERLPPGWLVGIYCTMLTPAQTPGPAPAAAGASPLGPRSGADCGKAQADGCPYRH